VAWGGRGSGRVQVASRARAQGTTDEKKRGEESRARKEPLAGQFLKAGKFMAQQINVNAANK